MNTSIAQIFGYLAGILAVVSYLPYISAVWKDRYKPDRDPTKCRPKRASWIIWAVSSWIIVATMKTNTATFSIYQAWAYGIGATVTLAVAIPYGEGGWRMIDRISLLAASTGLILWGVFNSAWYAFAIAMAADGVAILPIVKAKGRGEDPLAWSLFFLGSLANCVGVVGIDDKTLSTLNPRLADIVYPVGVAAIVSIPALMVMSVGLDNRFKLKFFK